MKCIGRQLREARLTGPLVPEGGYTQAELAEEVGVSEAYIRHIEIGRVRPNTGKPVSPSLWVLDKVAAVTGATFTIG